jgi:tricorn protease
LPIAHAEFGSLSPDGKRIAFTDKTRAFRTWKRYRGGTAPDIIVFNLETFESERITQSSANDEFPMWIGDVIYYLSDQGEEMRYNLWKYDTKARRHVQVTFFKDMDVHFPSAGGREIVFEAGGDIHLLDTRSDQFKKIDIPGGHRLRCHASPHAVCQGLPESRRAFARWQPHRGFCQR